MPSSNKLSGLQKNSFFASREHLEENDDDIFHLNTFPGKLFWENNCFDRQTKN